MARRKLYDGFESETLGDLSSTNFTIFVSTPDVTPQVVASSSDAVAGPYAGTKMVRLNWATGGVFTRMRLLFGTDWDGADELFLRFRYRFDTNFSRTPSGGNAAVHCFRVFHFSPGNFYTDFVFGEPSFNRNIIEHIVDADGTASPGYDRIFPGGGDALVDKDFILSDDWHLLELYWKWSATTHCTFWKDGVIIDEGGGGKICDASGFAVTPKFPNFDFCSNYSPQSPGDDTNYLYIDEVELFDDLDPSGGGEAVTGSMSDASIQVAAGGSSNDLAFFIA